MHKILDSKSLSHWDKEDSTSAIALKKHVSGLMKLRALRAADHYTRKFEWSNKRRKSFRTMEVDFIHKSSK